jgi:hypothetical protein
MNNLSASEKSNVLVLLDPQLKPLGSKIRVGLGELQMPVNGFYVFADLQPMANWGHPVTYFLIDAETGKFVQMNQQFPPFDGGAPSNFLTLFDSRKKQI